MSASVGGIVVWRGEGIFGGEGSWVANERVKVLAASVEGGLGNGICKRVQLSPQSAKQTHL